MMRPKTARYLTGGLIILAVILIIAGVLRGRLVVAPARLPAFNPVIDPADFQPTVANRYFTLVPRTKYVYETKTGVGVERIEVYVTTEKKTILGVETIVVRDRVWLNDQLIEDTRDWYAEDRDGNVWYFGEDTIELAAGQVVSRAGSWEAGVDGAKPGLIMGGKPVVGEVYRQEYYAGKAEDAAQILSLNESVTVPFGSLAKCLKTLDFTPLEPKAKEYKYYCPEIGGVALEFDLENGEKAELVSFQKNVELTGETGGQTMPKSPSLDHQNQDRVNSSASQPSSTPVMITAAAARAIALQAVPGQVTDVVIENKAGQSVYVVEIAATDGSETDVSIDINTGKIVSIEK